MIRNIFAVITACAVMAESSAFIVNRTQITADACGITKIKLGLIVRGQNFPRGSFPWIIALLHTGLSPPKFFCGATLISTTFVISAAHCIHEKHTIYKFLCRDVLAFFGAHDLNNYLEAGRYSLSPKKITLHDDWNARTSQYDGDLALLEFEEGSIHYNDYVQPICLWGLNFEPIVTDATVTGWGKSEDSVKSHEDLPKLLKVHMQSNEECFLAEKSLTDLSSKRTFCAGLKNGSGVCHGDSGGGLFIRVNGVYYLKGIVSSSLNTEFGCDVLKDAIYTNVLKFRKWIADTTEGAIKFITPQSKQVSAVSARFDIPSNRTFPRVKPGIIFKLPAFKNVSCVFEKQLTRNPICVIYQAIESDDYVLKSKINVTIETADFHGRKDIKFVPKLFGEKFPNLQDFWAWGYRLTVLRDFYFEKMYNLKDLNLEANEITKIERNAFKDLISVEWLHLGANRIETFDGKLFDSMIQLEKLNLQSNKIKFLSSNASKIPVGKLRLVSLMGNECIDELYNKNNWDKLELDLMANCTSFSDLKLSSITA